MTTQLDLPARMRGLKLDKHGRPVPWFAAVIDGVPDFRVIRADGIRDAQRFQWCWVMRVEWYAHGRAATRAEVLAAIDGGLPLLQEICDSENTVTARAHAHRALDQQHQQALELVPS